MAHLYIAFVDTPGFFALLIRKYLGQRYVHVAVSGDAELAEAYSVGRRNPAVPLLSGFEKEDKDRIFRRYPTAFYRICELSCTPEQKRNLMERLRADYRRRFRIHYAVWGLPFLVLGIPFYLKDRYTCSSYLARILLENGISVSRKHFSLVTPRDFMEYGGMRQIFEGPLAEMVSAEPGCEWEGLLCGEDGGRYGEYADCEWEGLLCGEDGGQYGEYADCEWEGLLCGEDGGRYGEYADCAWEGASAYGKG